jgi:hypothetical protein
MSGWEDAWQLKNKSIRGNRVGAVETEERKEGIQKGQASGSWRRLDGMSLGF